MGGGIVYQVAITSGLRAHFKQPDGPSKAGTDWDVSISRGQQRTRVFVRTYDADFAGISDAELMATISRFVGARLESGWLPSDYQGRPGELTVPSGEAVSPSTVHTKKPWWRIW